DPRNPHPFPTRRSSDLAWARQNRALFRSDVPDLVGETDDAPARRRRVQHRRGARRLSGPRARRAVRRLDSARAPPPVTMALRARSEEHTSELQSLAYLV